jgi:hypothetical protein
MAKKKKKSNLERLMESKRADNLYETSYDDCRKWIRILNQEIFSNSLPPIENIDIRWRRKTFAYYSHIRDTEDPDYKAHMLCMNKRYRSKKFFVEVLAHELVHHYQFYNDQPMGHGPSFKKWSKAFNKKGLKLVEAYNEE